MSSKLWDTDSVSSIESSGCRERKNVQRQMSELRAVNVSLSNAVQRLSDALKEKEEMLLDMKEMHESKMLDMQEIHERNMLQLLERKLADASSICYHDVSLSASDQIEDSKKVMGGGGGGGGGAVCVCVWGGGVGIHRRAGGNLSQDRAAVDLCSAR